MDIAILMVLLFNLLLTCFLLAVVALGRQPRKDRQAEELNEDEDKRRRRLDEGLSNLMDYEPPTGLHVRRGD